MLSGINDLSMLKDRVISRYRLDSYSTAFSTSTDEHLLGAYLWNASLGAGFYPLLSFIEVALRNSISSDFTAKYGRWWWGNKKLRYKSFARGGERPDVVSSVVNGFSQARYQAISEKRKRYQASCSSPKHSEVIGATNFIVWEKLLDGEFMGDGLFWPSSLGQVFLGWPSEIPPSKFLSLVKDKVKTVREFRNRLAHHEPLWKAYGVMNESDAVEYLNQKLETALDLLQMISPDKRVFVKNSGLEGRLRRACSIRELHRYQRKVRKYAFTGKDRQIRLLSLALKRDGVIELDDNGAVFLLSPF